MHLEVVRVKAAPCRIRREEKRPSTHAGARTWDHRRGQIAPHRQKSKICEAFEDRASDRPQFVKRSKIVRRPNGGYMRIHHRCRDGKGHEGGEGGAENKSHDKRRGRDFRGCRTKTAARYSCLQEAQRFEHANHLATKVIVAAFSAGEAKRLCHCGTRSEPRNSVSQQQASPWATSKATFQRVYSIGYALLLDIIARASNN